MTSFIDFLLLKGTTLLVHVRSLRLQIVATSRGIYKFCSFDSLSDGCCKNKNLQHYLIPFNIKLYRIDYTSSHKYGEIELPTINKVVKTLQSGLFHSIWSTKEIKIYWPFFLLNKTRTIPFDRSWKQWAKWTLHIKGWKWNDFNVIVRKIE